MIDRVTGSGNALHEIAEREVTFYDLSPICRDDRQNRIGHPGRVRRMLFLLLRPEGKLAIRHHVPGLRKRRYPPPILQPRVPADVIPVQMRAHHIIDILEPDTHGLESLFETVAVHHVPERPCRARLVIADTRIDQDGVLRRLDQEALYTKNEPLGCGIDECRLEPGAVLLNLLLA